MQEEARGCERRSRSSTPHPRGWEEAGLVEAAPVLHHLLSSPRPLGPACWTPPPPSSPDALLSFQLLPAAAPCHGRSSHPAPV